MATLIGNEMTLPEEHRLFEYKNTSMESATLTLKNTPILTDDFASILRYYNLGHGPADLYYYQVGEITRVQGWILHVSVIKHQVKELLTILIPKLASAKVPFKLIHSFDAAATLMGGHLGYAHTGKALRIYPETDQQALALAEELVRITRSFRGPEVPSDIHLGGTVYTRYGSFNPVLRKKINGQTERCIHDSKGQLVADGCSVPHQMPKHVSWPFANLTAPIPAKVNGYLSVLKESHVVTALLKADSKGNVFRTLRMKGLWFQWCLVKEGKHDTALDDSGRDTQDRLRWQYKLQSELSSEIPIPKVYDLYEERGNTYLVMEYITGESLYERSIEIHENTAWADLAQAKKLQLIEYLKILINYQESLHQRGIVHRDFAPDNFLFDKNNRLFMIDLELAYSVNQQYPDPPFTLGTNGFMSPEQWKAKTPTVKEDIYALGAMIIDLFTFMQPYRLGLGNPKQLEENLLFFIQDSDMADLIARCLHKDSKARPDLPEIKHRVDLFQARIKTQTETAPLLKDGKVSPTIIRQIVNDGINGLCHPVLCGEENLWFSNAIEGKQHTANEQGSKNYYPGLCSGIGGVMYMLAQAKKTGQEPGGANSTLINSYEYIKHAYLGDTPDLNGGLYFGSAGLAVALSEAIGTGLIAESKGEDMIRTKLLPLLMLPADGPNVATGTAGQILAVLKCYAQLDRTEADRLLGSLTDKLIGAQETDGSWIQYNAKQTGFSHGVAGITLSLMHYYSLYQNENTGQAIVNALAWLKKKAIKSKDTYTWPINSKNNTTNPSLHDGHLGVALCFLRAFELYGDPSYKQLAEGAMRNHPNRVVYRNLSFTHGTAGLGEVYIEASRILKEEVWKQRADWIAQMVTRTACYLDDDRCYWAIESKTTPTADLMIGNGGVMHFLMRYDHQNALSFPMF